MGVGSIHKMTLYDVEDTSLEGKMLFRLNPVCVCLEWEASEGKGDFNFDPAYRHPQGGSQHKHVKHPNVKRLKPIKLL